jgi:CBS domain-containing protein
MAQTVREIMSPNPVTLGEAATVTEAAKAMRDHDIGVVVIEHNSELRGILTDRDIAVRVVAAELDPSRTRVSDIASKELVTVSPTDPAEQALRQMRERAIRRVVVADGGRPVGILSLGDLAAERDTGRVLADISTAPANS